MQCFSSTNRVKSEPNVWREMVHTRARHFTKRMHQSCKQDHYERLHKSRRSSMPPKARTSVEAVFCGFMPPKAASKIRNTHTRISRTANPQRQIIRRYNTHRCKSQSFRDRSLAPLCFFLLPAKHHQRQTRQQNNKAIKRHRNASLQHRCVCVCLCVHRRRAVLAGRED